MKDDLLKIISTYGVLPQLKYFQSEVFELVEAVINRELHWNYDTEIQDIRPLDEHIAEEIATNLGMDSDEVLRLKQISRLKEAFLGKEFSKSWEEYEHKHFDEKTGEYIYENEVD